MRSIGRGARFSCGAAATPGLDAGRCVSSGGANTNVKEAGCGGPDRQIGAVQEMGEPGRLAWWPSGVAVQAEAANHLELLADLVAECR